jgi:iron complex transport system substrate-binding protein
MRREDSLSPEAFIRATEAAGDMRRILSFIKKYFPVMHARISIIKRIFALVLEKGFLDINKIMNHITIKYLFFMTICFAVSCGRGAKPFLSGYEEEALKYAKGLSIRKAKDHVVVDVINPWTKGKVLQRYVLVDRNADLPEHLPAGTLLRTPLQKVAVYSAVHAAMIAELNEVERMSGVCEPHYIFLPSVKERIASGSMVDLGLAISPNVELMLNTGIEYVIATPFENVDYGAVGKTGIPIIEGADYMEVTPLGRAEWIKFFGLLFSRKELADSLFAATEARYLELKNLAEKTPSRPTALPEQKYGNSWYVPGNDSYVASLIRDAGGSYIFSELKGGGSIPLSFETVLDRAVHADVWLLKYNAPVAKTYTSLRNEYAPYAFFEAWRQRSIFACNTGEKPYYEETPVHPDYLLKDYIYIFHPDILPGYKMRYYEKMEE